jgi:hypothetical protein
MDLTKHAMKTIIESMGEGVPLRTQPLHNT